MSAIFGHFVTAKSEDLILFANGCESHAANLGGSFLLTQQAGAWKNLGYYPGVITAWCRKVRMKDGRELLVSQDEWDMGGYVGAMLDSVVFTGTDFKDSHLVQLEDWTGEICFLAGIGPTSGTEIGRLVRVNFADLNHDGVLDMSITAQFGSAKFTPSQQKECAAGHTPKIPVDSYVLDFLLQGDKFVIAPWSKRTQDKLNSALKSEW